MTARELHQGAGFVPAPLLEADRRPLSNMFDNLVAANMQLVVAVRRLVVAIYFVLVFCFCLSMVVFLRR